MSRVLAARLAPTRLVPYRWSGGGLLTSVPPLVDSPTRLTKMRRVAKTGDTTVITDTLQGYDRTPQDLTGATVVLTVTGPDGVTKIVNRGSATVLQNGTTDVGKVTYTIPANVAIPVGVSTFEFEASWNGGEAVLTFPDDSDGELSVRAQLG